MAAVDCPDCQYYSVLRADPSGTKSLREKYAAKLRGQYDDIIADILTAVRDEDIFGLEGDALATPDDNFEFDSDREKIQGFARWVRDELENGPLEVANENENRYIRNAYERGIKDANSELDTNLDPEEMIMGVHEEKLQQLYTRNYQALQDINKEVADEITQTLTEGLSDGVGPDEMARNLTDRVDKIGKTRATALARTEVMNAHSESKLDSYQQGGISEVVGQAEVSTAQDSRVCDDCAAHHGKVMSIENARGYLPYHVNCRCVWLPRTDVSQ